MKERIKCKRVTTRLIKLMFYYEPLILQRFYLVWFTWLFIVSAKCHFCPANVAICETIHASTTCEPPNNYCINHYVNYGDGQRTVNRT